MVGNIRALWRQFPVKQVAILGVLLSIGSIGGSTIHPFLPFLTHDFFPYLKSNQIGYYAGFLTSAGSTGVFLGCFMWGKLSDIVGRRPILLSSATAILVGTMLVGFSFSFLWTVGVMFFEGLLNGKLGVAKTYLYEICPPKFHSFAFSVVGLPSSVAQFVGPSLGGFLACPATRFQTFDKPVFKQFPYLLPCAVAACAQFCILIGGCFLLGESLEKSPKDEYIDLTEVSSRDAPEDKDKRPRQEESTCSLLRDRLVLIPCALYALLALVTICNNQMLPLLLVSDSQHGGYNFDAAEISIVSTTHAIYSAVTHVTITPYIASKFTYKTVFLSGVVLYAVGIILLPSMVNITGAVRSQQLLQTANSSDLTLNFTAAPGQFSTSPLGTESYIQPTTEMNATVTGQCRLAGDRRKTSQHKASDLPARVWGPLLLVLTVMEQGSTQSYLAVIVMVGNAGVQSNRGTVNGIAQTLAALSRLVGPAVSANLFAWTTDNGLPWPLDHHLSFYLVAVLCILVAVLCASLPASSNLPRADSLTVSEEGDRREEPMLEGTLYPLMDK
ncbi:PREDICTED: probable peptide/nitrate transporter At3g43790 isoform X1 [Branchiostoma belcheri]|uniref:Probable peptide/nitrate transporter At3g43790 isoform X1 n=2 Tax=Branchiostoma belcheri TaxID=7741 RepID=A0A6P5ATG4_BRABE|nr:PREDICTED: probable peptide/nitrate transporter At3g43790 isoform X1 [Branchiostoma belcheri]